MLKEAKYGGVRPGGRSEDVRQRVLNAAADELAEHGFEQFAVTRVAARAAVHHTTIYRRWPTKSRLVLDAVIDLIRERVPEPATGSLRADLREYFVSTAATLSDQRIAALIRGMLAVRPEDFAPERDEYWADRMAVLNAVFDNATLRGEIVAAGDRLRLVELISGPLWLRAFVTRGPIDDGYVARLVDDALRAIDFDDTHAVVADR